MKRVTIGLLRVFALLLIMSVSALALLSPAAAQETGTLKLNLATCRFVASASSTNVKESLSGDCTESWVNESNPPNYNPTFLLDGVAPDGGDGVTSLIWSGVAAGAHTITNPDQSNYVFTSAQGEAVTRWGVLFQHYFPTVTPVAQETGTMTLKLATCRVVGSYSTTSVKESMPSDCTESWDFTPRNYNPTFLLDGVAPDGGDGVTSLIWSGVAAGAHTITTPEDETYDFTSLQGEAVTRWGVFFEHYFPTVTPVAAVTPATGETYTLLISVRNCNSELVANFNQPQEGCAPGDGAFFNVTSQTGDFLGNCEAVSNGATAAIFAACSVEVPFGSTGFVTEDLESLPTGYVPGSNPAPFNALRTDSENTGPAFINVSQGDGSIPVQLPNTGSGLSEGTGFDAASSAFFLGLIAFVSLFVVAGVRISRRGH